MTFGMIMKSRYEEKAKLCKMDTYNFILYIKTKDIYLDIENDVKTRFYTWNYKLERPLAKGKKVERYTAQKVFVFGVFLVRIQSDWWKMFRENKDQKISEYRHFLRSDDEIFCQIESKNVTTNDKNKKAKGTKGFFIKRKLKFDDYNHCLEATQLENKITK